MFSKKKYTLCLLDNKDKGGFTVNSISYLEFFLNSNFWNAYLTIVGGGKYLWILFNISFFIGSTKSSSSRDIAFNERLIGGV